MIGHPAGFGPFNDMILALSMVVCIFWGRVKFSFRVCAHRYYRLWNSLKEIWQLVKECRNVQKPYQNRKQPAVPLDHKKLLWICQFWGFL